jgi:hypothetical protein
MNNNTSQDSFEYLCNYIQSQLTPSERRVCAEVQKQPPSE